ncbi:MAG: GlsB/YeaQ/YmgE family stress response membrane protein [Acidimicrobiia bacterium]|nr:GlsB/YeaQ/YmgE family stress response membrane protein [Acidimicrobiia bacterium]
MISTLIGAVIAGAIIGSLARLVLPGEQNISTGLTIGIGFAGALTGGLIAQAVGLDNTNGIDWIKHIIQVAVAAGGIVLYGNMQQQKRLP